MVRKLAQVSKTKNRKQNGYEKGPKYFIYVINFEELW